MGRADEIVGTLGLQPHPEGGWFREIHRSPMATVIYFLLRAGEFSRWHRVRSCDEVWQLVEGDSLQLLAIDPEMQRLYCGHLEPVSASGGPVSIVAAGWWQAARPDGAYSLVTCTVAPPFDFSRFDMMSDVPEAAAVVRSDFQGYADLI